MRSFLAALVTSALLGQFGVACAEASGSVPLTKLGLVAELERTLAEKDEPGLKRLHAWTGVQGRYEALSGAHIRRLLDLDISAVYLESMDSAMPSGGLRYNVEPIGIATIEYRQSDGGRARIQLPYGEADGRLYFSMLAGEQGVPESSDDVVQSDLRIAVEVIDPAWSNRVTYEVACVLDTNEGVQTVSYEGRGGTVRQMAGNRFVSCGLRLPGGDHPAVELKLSEGERLVYRSGQVVGAGTILYRPGT